MTFSRFGEPVTIEAPPADKVSEAPKTQSVKSEPTPLLPEPVGDVTTTLQFRPVLAAVASGCELRSENPPTAQTALLRSGDSCLDVGATMLELTRAKARAMFEESSKTWYVQLELDAATSRKFDAMAAQLIGQQLAVVAFGEVLVAPTIQSTEFDGKPTISGITAQMAARLQAALTQ